MAFLKLMKKRTLSITVSTLLLAATLAVIGCGRTRQELEKVEEPESDRATENIRVFSPQPNDIASLPLVIKGEARVFESTFNYRLRDEDGSVLVESFGMTDAPDVGQFGPFEVSVRYPTPKGRKGMLEVFEYSAKDGSEINMVRIPVRFKE